MLNIFKNNHVFLSLIVVFISSPIFAGCGSCQVQKKVSVQKKSSALITTIPDSGKLEGFVIASCGMCNFGYKKNRGCSLTIKIGDSIYPVKGTNIQDHGNAHSKEGFCSAIRVAYVSGEVKNDNFHSESFTLIESPK